MHTAYEKGSMIQNYYYSRNGNIPSYELKNSQSLTEANNIINEYSYGIKFGFIRDKIGKVRFVDCSEAPDDDLCTPN